MKSHRSLTPAAAVLVAGILLLALWGALRAAPPVTAPVPTLEGGYSGRVQLDWVLVGEYSDTLKTPTPTPTRGPKTPTPAATAKPRRPNLGRIDLGVLVRSSGSYTVTGSRSYTMTGYVDLAASQVFTGQHTIMATPVLLATPGPGTPAPVAVKLAVGPELLKGTFNGVTLTLESEQFPLKTSTGLDLLRQFRLVGRKVEGAGSIFEEAAAPISTTQTISTTQQAAGSWSGNVFEGEYRETFWGFSATPVTLIGRFRLVQPVFGTPTPTPSATPTPTATPKWKK